MEDPKVIKKILKELGDPKGEKWMPFRGYHALTEFDFRKDGKTPTFLPASGIPIKVFVNKQTGEIRIFPAKMFEKEK